MFNKNSLYISICIYLIIAVSILYYKPSFIFSDKGKKKLKTFGTGSKKNKSIFPLWFILFIIGIFIYVFISCVFSRNTDITSI
tara:strand:- start:1271 stop:1519 length:249 start_codon:yes stop_codon:yes gene_type:complete